MTDNSSAIVAAPVVPSAARGTALAACGVVAFSLSFPATVWALDGLGPWTATGARGVLAALLAGCALLVVPAPLPRRADWPALGAVAVGCAVAFPLLTTLALQTSTTAHSAVVIGLLPLATAGVSAWRTGRRHPPVFWAAAVAGAVAVAAFTLGEGSGRLATGDLYLVGALLLCAVGYAEGGRLAGHLPGWRVIAWGVVLAAPVNLLLGGWALGHEPVVLTGTAVAGLLYVAGVSQFLGFVVWYQGMGLIGVARASQLQLAQPLLTLVWAVLLMGERLPAAAPLTAAVVLACIVVTQRARA